jgi:transcriptional regulator with XRE-family HTH domain
LFWENFLVECAKKAKSPATVAEELGFSNSATTYWKNGSMPRMGSRKKIADYFGISVEKLMGTKKSPPGKASSKENGPTLKWHTRVQHRKHVQQPKPPRWPCWRAARKKDEIIPRNNL